MTLCSYLQFRYWQSRKKYWKAWWLDFKIYLLLSLCSITVDALGALAGRCSVTVLLPLSKWLFFGLFPLWWPISRRWWPKWVSRVIFEWSSLRVSAPLLDVLTFTDALMGFMGGLAILVTVFVQNDFDAIPERRWRDLIPSATEILIDIWSLSYQSSSGRLFLDLFFI